MPLWNLSSIPDKPLETQPPWKGGRVGGRGREGKGKGRKEREGESVVRNNRAKQKSEMEKKMAFLNKIFYIYSDSHSSRIKSMLIYNRAVR